VVDDVLQPDRPSTRGRDRSAAVVVGGLLAATVLAGGLVADAASDADRDGASQVVTPVGHDGGHDGSLAEQPLTGETADRVTGVERHR